jgi:hypothetical protein
MALPVPLLTIVGWLLKLPGLLPGAWKWVKAQPWRAVVLALALCLLWTGWRLRAARAGEATAQGRTVRAVAWAERLDAELEAQNAAVDNWRLQAQAAQHRARSLQAAAEAAYQVQLDRARELLERPKDPIGCPEAWDRLFQALEGLNYQEAP